MSSIIMIYVYKYKNVLLDSTRNTFVTKQISPGNFHYSKWPQDFQIDVITENIYDLMLSLDDFTHLLTNQNWGQSKANYIEQIFKVGNI